MQAAIITPILKYPIRQSSSTPSSYLRFTSQNKKPLRESLSLVKLNSELHIWNEVIRNVLSTTPVHWILKNRIKCPCHITQFPPNQPALTAYSTRHTGLRARGRHRRQWDEPGAFPLITHEVSLLQATHFVTDRRLCLPATLTGTGETKKIK